MNRRNFLAWLAKIAALAAALSARILAKRNNNGRCTVIPPGSYIEGATFYLPPGAYLEMGNDTVLVDCFIVEDV